jgi:hypothetical protein
MWVCFLSDKFKQLDDVSGRKQENRYIKKPAVFGVSRGEVGRGQWKERGLQ